MILTQRHRDTEARHICRAFFAAAIAYFCICYFCICYFCIRYFLKLGFLDGLAGFRWHFWQKLWYRWIVDREIGRVKNSCSPH